MNDRSSDVLPVTEYCPSIHDCSEDGKCVHLWSYATEVTASYEHGAYSIYEIMHRVDICCEIGPMRHGTHRGKQATHKHQYHHKEPHYENGLLHGFIVIGDYESETTEDE